MQSTKGEIPIQIRCDLGANYGAGEEIEKWVPDPSAYVESEELLLSSTDAMNCKYQTVSSRVYPHSVTSHRLHTILLISSRLSSSTLTAVYIAVNIPTSGSSCIDHAKAWDSISSCSVGPIRKLAASSSSSMTWVSHILALHSRVTADRLSSFLGMPLRSIEPV